MVVGLTDQDLKDVFWAVRRFPRPQAFLWDFKHRLAEMAKASGKRSMEIAPRTLQEVLFGVLNWTIRLGKLHTNLPIERALKGSSRYMIPEIVMSARTFQRGLKVLDAMELIKWVPSQSYIRVNIVKFTTWVAAETAKAATTKDERNCVEKLQRVAEKFKGKTSDEGVHIRIRRERNPKPSGYPWRSMPEKKTFSRTNSKSFRRSKAMKLHEAVNGAKERSVQNAEAKDRKKAAVGILHPGGSPNPFGILKCFYDEAQRAYDRTFRVPFDKKLKRFASDYVKKSWGVGSTESEIREELLRVAKDWKYVAAVKFEKVIPDKKTKMVKTATFTVPAYPDFQFFYFNRTEILNLLDERERRRKEVEVQEAEQAIVVPRRYATTAEAIRAMKERR